MMDTWLVVESPGINPALFEYLLWVYGHYKYFHSSARGSTLGVMI